MLAVLVLLARARLPDLRPQTRAMILAASILFGLGAGLVLLRLEVLPRIIVELGLSGDLLLLGYAIAVQDAFEQGETLKADLLRSLLASMATAAIFGGLVGITITLSTGATSAMITLLLFSIGASILIQSFPGALDLLVDRVALAANRSLQSERATLQETARAIPRLNTELDLTSLSEEDFIRLTRKALSSYANLPRLASNPLTRLRLIKSG